MRPHSPSILACSAFLAITAFAAPALAQGTPIFTEDQKILASDGAEDDNFGFAVSVSGDLMIIGAKDVHGAVYAEAGAAYIYLFNGSEWVEEAKLTHPEEVYNGAFGYSVAIHGDIAVSCAHKDADPNNPYGAAYIYRYNGEDWELEAKCTGNEHSSSSFGLSVAAHDGFVVVGDHRDDESGGTYPTGAASVFRYDDSNWVLEAKLYGSLEVGGQGWSVATDGQQIILGSNDLDNDQYVFIFRWIGNEWAHDASVGYSYWGDWYGRSVDILGNLAVVGCSSDYDDNAVGKVFIYRSTGAPNYEWAQEAIIEASDKQSGDYFGEAVAVADEQTVVVQAFGHELDGYGHSTLYVFRKIDGDWTETGRLTTSDTGGFFGVQAAPTLSADETLVVVGAPFEDNQNGVNAGSAFYFRLSCPGDLNGDLVVDQSDLGILLAAYEVDAGGDVDGDGDTDQADLGALLANYDAICP